MKCPHCNGKKCIYCLRTGKMLTTRDKDFVHKKQSTKIYSCYKGSNDKLIENVLLLYSRPNDTIADVTYAHGAFWRTSNMSIYNFLTSDLLTGTDFRNLPYKNNSIDIGVIDPPYMSYPGNTLVNDVYNNNSTHNMSIDDILDLYAEGIQELQRVVKQHGLIWVKCQDESQRFTHIEIYNIALNLGLVAKDLFILHQVSTTPIQGVQQIAKKNHSYLWIFEKEKY